jgi:hypothetical protein
VMGHRPSTITRWLARDGQHRERLHERLFKELTIVHIQVDELVNRVRRWAKRAWVWTAQDVQSNSWLAWHVGGHPQADAHRLVHQVKAVLAIDCVPVFTSDGLRQYFYAMTAHFGVWVEEAGKRKPVWQVLSSLLHGQFRKVKVGRKLKQVINLHNRPESRVNWVHDNAIHSPHATSKRLLCGHRSARGRI